MFKLILGFPNKLLNLLFVAISEYGKQDESETPHRLGTKLSAKINVHLDFYPS